MKKEESAKFLKLCLAEALIKMMGEQPYGDININAVCKNAGVGRTTYYRYFDRKSSKEDLLVFKVVCELEEYKKKHEEEAKADGMRALLNFAYENREIFRLMYKNGLLSVILKIFDSSSDWKEERESAYVRAFFVYGCFGVVYQWIKYDFDQTPEEISAMSAAVIQKAIEGQAEGKGQ